MQIWLEFLFPPFFPYSYLARNAALMARGNEICNGPFSLIAVSAAEKKPSVCTVGLTFKSQIMRVSPFSRCSGSNNGGIFATLGRECGMSEAAAGMKSDSSSPLLHAQRAHWEGGNYVYFNMRSEVPFSPPAGKGGGLSCSDEQFSDFPPSGVLLSSSPPELRSNWSLPL